MTYSLATLKEHLEKNAGDTGIKIFQTSAARLKIGEQPSPEQMHKFIKEIEHNMVLFFGSTRTKEILNKLEKESSEAESLLESEIKQELETLFTKKGIPGESELLEISRYIVAKGYNWEENKVFEILKQLSKKKVLSALNDSIIRYEIQRFVDKYPSFTTAEIGNFINYLRDKKIELSTDALMEMIEKERLYRKFEEKILDETWQEKLSRQYVGLFNSPENSAYKYLMVDEELTGQLLKKISK